MRAVVHRCCYPHPRRKTASVYDPIAPQYIWCHVQDEFSRKPAQISCHEGSEVLISEDRLDFFPEGCVTSTARQGRPSLGRFLTGVRERRPSHQSAVSGCRRVVVAGEVDERKSRCISEGVPQPASKWRLTVLLQCWKKYCSIFISHPPKKYICKNKTIPQYAELNKLCIY